MHYFNGVLFITQFCIQRMGDKKKVLEPPFETDGLSVAPSDVTQRETEKRIKNGKPLQTTMGLFEEYCSSSTVHGVRYIGDKQRHWLERVWWIFAFALALYYCGTLIQNVYMRWDQSPVIVSFAVKSTPVWEIPFPAVTICPETKANMSQLNFTKVYHIMLASKRPPYNITDEEELLMGAVVQVCEPYLTDYFEIGENFTDSSITELLRGTAPSLNDTMLLCGFRNDVDYCQKYFEEIMTEAGLCFTFNALNGSELYNKLSPDYKQLDHNMSAKYWSLENGYNSSIYNDSQTYPYRVFESGTRLGLIVLLQSFEQHLEYICNGAILGYKILLHAPGEVPQVSKQYFQVSLDQEVKPNIIATSEGLRHYDPNRKQCYFQSERKLRFIKVYTQSNCELECLANITLSVCGCVKFSMPRDKNTPICGAAKIACHDQAKSILMEEKFLEGLPYNKDEGKVKGCNCLPACTSITYDAEITQTPLDWKNVVKAHKMQDEFPKGMRPARMTIFFKEDHFSTSRRTELYTFSEFVANCGGLVGLFVGASFLSIVELLYFFSLRLSCNLRAIVNRKRKNKIADSLPGTVVAVDTNADDQKE